MAESETIQTVVTQVTIQAVMAAVMAMSEADAGTTPGTNAFSLGETHRQRHVRPDLR